MISRCDDHRTRWPHSVCIPLECCSKVSRPASAYAKARVTWVRILIDVFSFLLAERTRWLHRAIYPSSGVRKSETNTLLTVARVCGEGWTMQESSPLTPPFTPQSSPTPVEGILQLAAGHSLRPKAPAGRRAETHRLEDNPADHMHTLLLHMREHTTSRRSTTSLTTPPLSYLGYFHLHV